MIFDQTGNLANMKRHDYLPFGEELGSGIALRTTTQGYGGGDAVRQQFTLKERDVETGLNYFLARFYSSTQGRFTSPDEFKGGPEELFEKVDPHDPLFYADTSEPQSLNKYHYALNNPLKFVDPDGHQATMSTVGTINNRP
jgi:RHS repeat-associated protein